MQVKWKELGVVIWYPAGDGAAIMPALVLLPGMGRSPADYTTIAQDLASYGYLIAGVTPSRMMDARNLSDPALAHELLSIWSADASFALDQLLLDRRFRIDAARVGIFGHSFGGNVALHELITDQRFARAANLDGSLYGGPIDAVRKPMLILCADGIDPEWQPFCKSGRAECADFPKARHMDFADVHPALQRETSDRLRTFFSNASEP